MDPSSFALPSSSVHACAFVDAWLDDAWLWAPSFGCRSIQPSEIRPCGVIRRQSAVWHGGKKKSCSSSHNPTNHLHDFSLVFPISFLFPLSLSLSLPRSWSCLSFEVSYVLYPRWSHVFNVSFPDFDEFPYRRRLPETSFPSSTLRHLFRFLTAVDLLSRPHQKTSTS